MEDGRVERLSTYSYSSHLVSLAESLKGNIQFG